MNFTQWVFVTALLSLFFGESVGATRINWTGSYRFEALDIGSTDLNGGGGKFVFLHRANLRPHILAADGFKLIGNIEVFSNNSYPNDQVGSWLGGQPSFPFVGPFTQEASSFSIREFYLRWEMEHAELVFGRAPFEFGVGASFSAGTNGFDHFSDAIDMISYKMYAGNLLLQPILARRVNLSPDKTGSLSDFLFHVQYKNEDAGAEISLLRRETTADKSVNDAYLIYDSGVNSSYTNTVAAEAYKIKSHHLYFSRDWEKFSFRIESGFLNGSTGILTSGGSSVDLTGYGMALEFDWAQGESPWKFDLLMGMASGDDPQTSNFEGYSFHRNYNIGFLLANHPMGGFDILTTRNQRTRVSGSILKNEEALDEEVVSNMIYFSPQFNRKISDKWTWSNRLVYASLLTNSSRSASVDLAKDLGYEWDTGLIYSPYERFKWMSELGVLLPGGAFTEGGTRSTQMVLGLQTKLLIEF